MKTEDVTQRSKRVKLGYLQTQKALGEDFDFLAAIAAKEGGSTVTFNDSQKVNIPGGAGVQGGKATVSKINQIADTGWVKGAEKLEPRNDRLHSAIGVRDVIIGESEYAEKSALVTNEYIMPRSIRSLAIESDETVPVGFPAARYIRFEASFEGGDWQEFYPMNGDGKPKTLTLNYSDDNDNSKKVDATEARRFRLRITIERPTGESFKRQTPVLRGYKLNVGLVD